MVASFCFLFAFAKGYFSRFNSLKKEIIQGFNGSIIELVLSSNGNCFCPVCGEESPDKEWRPYDKKGYPSYDICSCGFQYGFDDFGESSYENSWKIYREKWINNKIDNHFISTKTKEEKIRQLKNLEF